MLLRNSSLLKSQLFINGEWCNANTQHTFPVINPATGETIAQVANAGAEETRNAITAAEAALKNWSAQTAKTRSNILRKWFNLLIENQEDLAMLLTLEQGKPLAEARGEIAYGANYIEWFAEEAKRIYGDVISPPATDKRIVTLKQPIGVVAAITPWNFPNAMLARKLAPALAAGCTVVAKPASQTPLSALALVALAQEAGVPAGVVNIVCGKDSAAIGSELTSNPIVKKITFTGSTSVGKELIAQSASTVKKIALELGGNAPFIVFEDADLDAAVEGAMASKFRNAGQTCVCVNRFYVHQKIYDLFLQKLNVAIQQLKIGYGTSEGVSVGPLITPQAIAKIVELVDDAKAQGAGVNYVKEMESSDDLTRGYFYPPTVLVDVPAHAKLCREEIFGPVAALVKFATEDEVIALANTSEFGLAAYFYTQDPARIWRVAEQLEVGMVGINEGIISNEMAPFGGIKQSGYGREGSRYGLDDYLTIKYLCQGGIAGQGD